MYWRKARRTKWQRWALHIPIVRSHNLESRICKNELEEGKVEGDPYTRRQGKEDDIKNGYPYAKRTKTEPKKGIKRKREGLQKVPCSCDRSRRFRRKWALWVKKEKRDGGVSTLCYRKESDHTKTVRPRESVPPRRSCKVTLIEDFGRNITLNWSAERGDWKDKREKMH